MAQKVRLERYGAGEIVQRVGEIPNGHRYILAAPRPWPRRPTTAGSCRSRPWTKETCWASAPSPGQGLQASQTANTDLAVLFVPVEVLDELVKTRPKLARDVGTELDNRRILAKGCARGGRREPRGRRNPVPRLTLLIWHSSR